MEEIENTVIEQLNNFCCLDLECESELSRLVLRLIQELSLKTCWTHKPCETLLFNQRTEFLVLPCRKCNPCGNVIYFSPFYYIDGADLSDVEIKLCYYDGLDYIEEELSEEQFKLNERTKDIAINLPQGDCCCDTKRELKITYNSGFHALPDCLLPILCDLLHQLKERNFCGCGNCATCSIKEEENKIIDEKEKYIDYLNAWINEAEFSTLESISLCYKFKRILGADSCEWY